MSFLVSKNLYVTWLTSIILLTNQSFQKSINQSSNQSDNKPNIHNIRTFIVIVLEHQMLEGRGVAINVGGVGKQKTSKFRGTT